MEIFKLTQPRCPISAMYTSPGPCYILPALLGERGHDPRSTYDKGPGYHFGIRTKQKDVAFTPGPKYHLDEPKIYRDGKNGVPHYSLYSVTKARSVDRTPAPDSYNLDKSKIVTFPCPPMYSFGKRHQKRFVDNVPAPNMYTLPTVLGKTIEGGKKQSPMYSLGGRKKVGHFYEDFARTPGPAIYNPLAPNRYYTNAPQYTMRPQTVPPTDPTDKPGPGAHYSEKCWAHKRTAPGYSFGTRHSQYITPLIIEILD